jgi:hypothetical protein
MYISQVLFLFVIGHYVISLSDLACQTSFLGEFPDSLVSGATGIFCRIKHFYGIEKC